MLHKGTYQSAPASPSGDRKSYSRVTRILWRIAHIAVGIILVWLPWTGAWENNLALWLWPQIGPVVLSPVFKGAVLGLGIDNILIGIHDVIYARFAPQRHFS